MKSKAKLETAHVGVDVDYVENQLRHGIQTGRFVSGQRLVETDLAAEFGVARGPIREALRRLQSDGLVEIQRHKGASVRKISRKELRDVFEVLEALCMLILQKVFDHLDEGKNRKLIEASLEKAKRFQERTRHLGQVEEYMKENARFFDVLCDVCGNDVLERTRDRLQILLFSLEFRGLTIASNRIKWVEKHPEILSAILDGDRKKAARLLRHSVHSIRDALLTLPDSAFR